MKINFLIPVYLIQATLLFVLLLLVLGLTSLYYIAPEPHPEVDEDEVEFIEKVKDWFDKEQVGQENESDNTRSWDSQDRLEADVSFYECTVCHNQFLHWTHKVKNKNSFNKKHNTVFRNVFTDRVDYLKHIS